ncbi:MAG TPA: M81 family metallopeptidase [Azospirillaceae bacterium]|nr:M81 family metallopeptidase [Azospirillaceae bacterium]
MPARRSRIAVLGILLESNRFAPPAIEADFRAALYLEGDDLVRFCRNGAEDGFAGQMDLLRDWELVPILIAAPADSSGPCDHASFERICGRIVELLRAAGTLDGVYVIGHGAGTTTETDDLDGEYLERVRAAVGPAVPIAMLTDTHANPSDRLFANVDLVTGYRTNPHVDFLDRSRDAARLMHRMLDGWRPRSCHVRVPLITPQVTQLTAEGHPLGDLMRLAEASLGDDIATVSVWSGFSLADVPHAGLTVYAAAWSDAAAARQVARAVAEHAWHSRHRFKATLTPLDQAVQAALAADAGRPVILADVADNPGGGAQGNTTWILEALLDAGATDVLLGLVWDPDLVAAAFAAGRGGRIRARVGRDSPELGSRALPVEAEVLCLRDAPFRGRTGMAANRSINLGPSCLVCVGGVQILAGSVRQQILGPEYFEVHGADPAAARAIVVKSRGHYRAGFADLVPAPRILDVDVPGLATPHLERVPYRRVTRPVYPLDPGMEWRAAE